MNLQRHPVLRGDHYFHRLVDSNLSGATWSEGIASVSEGGSGTNISEQIITKGRVPDPLVARLEDMTQKYREGIRSIERGQSKLLKRLKGTLHLWSINLILSVYICFLCNFYFKDESNVLGELGASFNAFSLELNETNQIIDSEELTNQKADPSTNEIKDLELSTNQNQSMSFRSQLEMIGQSSDSEVIHLHSLIRHHELLRDRLQEIILYCSSILRSLNNLTQKRANLEEFHDVINGKKNILMQMESNVRAGEEGDENLQKLKKSITEVKEELNVCVVNMYFM